ncbi:MAG TPA: hypothetical protein VFC00_02505, partial [Micromonosporaceae bacterium]|nr:hypothetical protein [Micromonosporaceae bacterium]
MSRHVVRRASEASFVEAAPGFRRWAIVDESVPGAVHTGFGICELDPGGTLAGHVHSFEQSM